MTAHTLNRRLAELTGWTDIIELGGALLGTPPAGEPQCRNQAKVPDWEGDWRDCGPLMVEHDCYPAEFPRGVMVVFHSDMGWLADRSFSDSTPKQSATRYTIVSAVIAKLEAGQ